MTAADVNALDERGWTALRYTHLGLVEYDRRVKIARVLRAAGASENGKDRHGMTALVKAARNAPSHVKLLLSEGSDPNLKAGENGETALMVAAENGHVEAVEQLLAHGADVNAQDNKGRTALMRAARKRNAEMVKLLLDRGARMDIRDHEGRPAF